MKLNFKLSLKYLGKNKFRTILTLLGIIVSVAMMVSVTILYSSFINNIIKDATTLEGDYDFKITNPDNLDLSNLSKFKDVKDLYKLDNSRISRIHTTNSQLGLDYYQTLNISRGDKYFFKNVVDEDYLLEGRLPEKDNEILVSYDMKYIIEGFDKIGNSVELPITRRVKDAVHGFDSAYLLEDEIQGQPLNQRTYRYIFYDELQTLINKEDFRETYTIVGYHNGESRNLSYDLNVGVENLAENILIYGSDVVAFDSKIEDTYDLYVRFKNYNNLDDNKKILNNIADDRVEINESLIGYKDPSVMKNFDLFGTLFYLTGGLILFAVIIFILNIFTSNYVERIKDLGILKVTGFTNKQLTNMVFIDSLFYILVAIPLGFLVGVISMKVLLDIVTRVLVQYQITLKFNLGISFDNYTIFYVVIVGVLVILLSNFLSASFVFRSSPIDALKGNSKKDLVNYKPRKRRLMTKLLGVEGFLASRNIDRNKSRFIMTTISIAMSIMLFVVISGFSTLASNANLDTLTDKEETNIQLTTQSKFMAPLREDLDNVGGNKITYQNNEFYTGYAIKELVVNDEFNSLQLISIDDDFFNKRFGQTDDILLVGLDEKIEEYYNPDKQGYFKLNIVKLNADQYGKKIDVEGSDKTINVRQIKYNSANLIEDFGNLSVLLTRSSNLNKVLENFETNYVETRSLLGIQRTNVDIQTSYEIQAILAKYPETFVSSGFIPVLRLIQLFVYGFISLITIIVAINIVNATYTNTITRRKELALLKTIGIESKKLKRIVLYENMISIIIGSLISLLGSTALTYYMFYYDTQETIFESLNTYRAPIVTWLVAVAISSLLIYIFVTIPYNRIMKDNITDVLK